MKKAISILLFIVLNSCSFEKERGIKVIIENSSSEPITNLEFNTTENLEIIRIERIEPKEQITEFLSMEKNVLDGAYSLSFARANGETEFTRAGYYTNGGPLDRTVKYTIEADTTLVVFSDFY